MARVVQVRLSAMNETRNVHEDKSNCSQNSESGTLAHKPHSQEYCVNMYVYTYVGSPMYVLRFTSDSASGSQAVCIVLDRLVFN